MQRWSGERLFRNPAPVGGASPFVFALVKKRDDSVTTTRREVMAGGVLLASVGSATLARARNISPSPEWTQAMPSAPVPGTKITEEYAALVGRDVYFWAWPLVNVYIRRLVRERVPETMISGAVPVAPLNWLSMLSDYITPEERAVACPNQDVVYGGAVLALDLSPVVI